MPYDGLPARAGTGAREVAADRQAGTTDAGTLRRPVTAPTTAAVRTRRRGIRLAALGITAIGLVIAACGTTASTGAPIATGAAPASVAASESAATSPSGSGGLNQGFMTFQEVNASKVFGGGTITDLGEGSAAVTLGVVAVGYEDPLPARLVAGSCADAASQPSPSYEPPPSEAPSGAASAAPSAAASEAPSASAAASASAEASGAAESMAPQTLPIELTPVSGGGSNTVIQFALSDLLASPSAVLIYKSAAEPTLVACSDVTPTLVIPSTAPAAGSAAPSVEASAPASAEPSAS